MKTHLLGYPRLGQSREYKFLLEKFWRGEIDEATLLAGGKKIRCENWQQQLAEGIDWISVGDFSWYDHVLDTSIQFGVIPKRFRQKETFGLNDYFAIARGQSVNGETIPASRLCKWFDTNYHIIVPEFEAEQTFICDASRIIAEIKEAQQISQHVKPVILGPLSFLWLGQAPNDVDKLSLLDSLLESYQALLEAIRQEDVEWIQIDEPILALDLPQAWKNAFEKAYHRLNTIKLNKLLAVYFGGLEDNLSLACQLPVEGLHIDAIRAPQEIKLVLDKLAHYKVLSLGTVDGRNIWRADLDSIIERLTPIYNQLKERLWLAPSCSLLHVPITLSNETNLDSDIKPWLAFANEKITEIAVIANVLKGNSASHQAYLEENKSAHYAKTLSTKRFNVTIQKELKALKPKNFNRPSSAQQRAILQQQTLSLPKLPTTTIGSFPQTQALRQVRRCFKQGDINRKAYLEVIKNEVRQNIQTQEEIGLDVLVHGEPERTDMVEFFAEYLDGVLTTEHGWVQSYGSRCVKPPVIYGDIKRKQSMTTELLQYAQSLTDKPVKGMLTGPVTILCWSFVREDQAKSVTANQLALALREEIHDLEQVGIAIIQVDEAAFREGLPLRKQAQKDYFDWATSAFRLATAGVKDETQIHTHMCYSEFKQIAQAINLLDVDVISLESARASEDIGQIFGGHQLPVALGPGVYDIHSPEIPSTAAMKQKLEGNLKTVPESQLWINPDCGLKTRTWDEVIPALNNMVKAAHELRH